MRSSINGQFDFVEDDELLKEVYDSVHEFFVEDTVVTNVLRRYEKRSQEGMVKYGTTMEGNAGSLEYWLENALEEAMDLTLYLQRSLDEIRSNGGKI